MDEISSALRWLWLVALVVGCASHALTANSQGASAKVSEDAPQPIAQSDYAAVDGARLFLTVRGDNRRALLLLWLHGGPGGAREIDPFAVEMFVIINSTQLGVGERAHGPRRRPSKISERHRPNTQSSALCTEREGAYESTCRTVAQSPW